VSAIIDTSFELQKAIVRVLRDAGTSAGDRVYNPVPASAKFPYISMGLIQVLNEKYDGLTGVKCFVTLHAWSQERSRVEIHTIGRQIIAALDGVDEEMSRADLDVRSCEFEDAQYIDDPDGLTAHAVLTFQVLTD
jgi:hypothetical protein